MKCNSCKIDISPGYTKALNENMCPACGEAIMSELLFNEFDSIKAALSDSAVTESDLVKVASLIAGKYALVPKDSIKQPGKGQRFSPKPITRMGGEEVTTPDRDADLASLSPDNRAREKALRDAEEDKVAAEWGLASGEMSASITLSGQKTSDITQEAMSSEVMELSSIIGGGMDDEVIMPNMSSSNAFEAQRMARLETLRSDPVYSSVRRSEG